MGCGWKVRLHVSFDSMAFFSVVYLFVRGTQQSNLSRMVKIFLFVFSACFTIWDDCCLSEA